MDGHSSHWKKITRVIVSIYGFKDGKVFRGLTKSVVNELDLLQQEGVLPSTEEIIQAYKESHNME